MNTAATDDGTKNLAVFDEIKTAILPVQKILIISHKSPDADTIGANLALREALENLGKTVESACINPVPQNCIFLKKSDTFLSDFEPENYDLIITVDCGGYKLTGFTDKKPVLLDRHATNLINIDHHPSNDHFGRVNLVMSETPSTCFILFLMFTYYGWNISQEMATAMLHGIYYDTGSFMHSNTTAATLRVAARLKALGADLEKCTKEQFHTSPINKLKLYGRAFSHASINSKNAVVSILTKEDFYELGASQEDASGLINYLNHVPQTKFSLLLTEDPSGLIKGSLRTQDEQIDLSEIAQLFGGGGHKKAAGFSIKGRLSPKTSWQID